MAAAAAGVAAIPPLPGLKSRDDLYSEGDEICGPVGHGRSPGKETAKGLAKKFSANEKVTPPDSLADSFPGEDSAAGWNHSSSIESVVGSSA